MWFGYHPDIVEQFPEIAAAVVWIDRFDNVKSVPKVDDLLTESDELVRERCPERAAIAQQPPIAAWRDAYSRMGLKPNRYPCATEQLMRRLVDGQPIPRIAALVDLGNAAALRYMITVAPFDLDRLQGFCEVRHADGGERFFPINSDTPDEIPAGEVIFADDSPDVISRRWAWRQSDKGKITPGTERVVMVAEAVHNDARGTVVEAGEFLCEHLSTSLNAHVRLEILDREQPQSTLRPT